MATHEVELHIDGRVRDVVKHFKAFLEQEAAARPVPNQVTVTRKGNSFIEVERNVEIEMEVGLLAESSADAQRWATTTTAYEFSADPAGGTRLKAAMTIDDEFEMIISAFAELMGEDVSNAYAANNPEIQEWAASLTKFVAQKQAPSAPRGGLEA